jgi:hypothetical protein
VPRTSAAALSIVPGAALDEIRRPIPPSELSLEQRNEWLAVVNRLPAEWFPRETHPLLAQYCRHVVAARRISQLVDRLEADADNFSVEEYDRLLKMQEREGRALSSLATRMRITQQSTYDKTERKQTKSAARPWANPGRAEHPVD